MAQCYSGDIRHWWCYQWYMYTIVFSYNFLAPQYWIQGNLRCFPCFQYLTLPFQFTLSIFQLLWGPSPWICRHWHSRGRWSCLCTTHILWHLIVWTQSLVARHWGGGSKRIQYDFVCIGSWGVVGCESDQHPLLYLSLWETSWTNNILWTLVDTPE